LGNLNIAREGCYMKRTSITDGKRRTKAKAEKQTYRDELAIFVELCEGGASETGVDFAVNVRQRHATL